MDASTNDRPALPALATHGSLAPSTESLPVPEGGGPLPMARFGSNAKDLGVIAAALLIPVAFAVYVLVYGVDVPQLLDWQDIPMVHAALHGHLDVHGLWAQYNESRVPAADLVFIAFGLGDHLNFRALLLFDACTFVASYWILLVLVRAYKRAPLSVANVLILGVAWFSLVDAQNPLLSFMLTWYLLVACFLVMLYLLLAAPWTPKITVPLACVAGVIASFSAVQGFLLWPIGIACILWESPWTRSILKRATLMLAASITTGALYFNGFDTSNNGCIPSDTCTIGYALHHLDATGRFLLVVLGSVFPPDYLITFGSGSASAPTFLVQELIGALLLALSAVVLFVAVRERKSSNRIPVPAMLILFALLFASMMSTGRAGLGLRSAIDNNRFVMPGLIMVVGIIVHFIGHLPGPIHDGTGRRRSILQRAVLGLLLTLLFVQVVASTQFGLDQGRSTRTERTNAARLLTNLDRLSVPAQGCELSQNVFYGFATPELASSLLNTNIGYLRTHQLSLFVPAEYAHWRALGLPPLSPGCVPAQKP